MYSALDHADDVHHRMYYICKYMSVYDIFLFLEYTLIHAVKCSSLDHAEDVHHRMQLCLDTYILFF